MNNAGMDADVCYIVGAGDFSGFRTPPGEGSYVIAADGGLKYLEDSGIRADIVLGDFDSLGYVPQHDNVVRYPVMKDDTDMMLAVKAAIEKKYKKIVIYGGMGGRPDHFIANIQALAYIAKNGGRGYMLDDITAVTVINDRISFTEDYRGKISVLCHGGIASGINIKGFMYNVSDFTMDCTVPLGVSNEFIGKKADISVEKGMLTVIWEGNTGAALPW